MGADIDPIDPATAAAEVEAGRAILVDVRDRSAFDSAHATPAVGIPIDQLAARLEELPAGTTVITTCGGGTRGPRAAALLREHDIDARPLAGGLRAWRAADLPVVEEPA
ncbi:MAG: Rhodanese domain protein [Thermoleophilia bacterium]|nr:Rhodanese domain protein [Thermoleophilia bacterium]